MKKEIIKANGKLIAEFMGWKENESGYYPATPNIYNWKGEAEFEGAYQGNKPIYMFHQSWDWLMPVIEKIELSGPIAFTINRKRCSVYRQKIPFGDYIIETKGTSKLDATYQAVVQFIKQLNQE